MRGRLGQTGDSCCCCGGGGGCCWNRKGTREKDTPIMQGRRNSHLAAIFSNLEGRGAPLQTCYEKVESLNDIMFCKKSETDTVLLIFSARALVRKSRMVFVRFLASPFYIKTLLPSGPAGLPPVRLHMAFGGRVLRTLFCLIRTCCKYKRRNSPDRREPHCTSQVITSTSSPCSPSATHTSSHTCHKRRQIFNSLYIH